MLRARRPAAPSPRRLPIAGYVGIACGVTAWYVAFAYVANATFGGELFPVWALK